MTETTIHQTLLKGIEAHKAGYVQKAEKYYTAILKVQPKHPDANHNMGILSVGIGNVQDALPFFKRALEAYPEKLQFWLSLINVLIKLDRIEEANTVYKLAGSYLNKDGFDKLEKKISSFEIKIKKLQNLPNEELNSLLSLYKQHKFLQVHKETQILTQQYTNNTTLWNLMGASAAQIGLLDDAVFAFQNALKIEPDCAEAYNNLGNVLKNQGKLDEAVEAYVEALSIKPDFAEACNNMGNCLKDQVKIDEAVVYYEMALSLKPNYAEAHNNIGVSFKAQGKLYEAIEAFKKALYFKPDYVEAAENAFGLLTQVTCIKSFRQEFEKLFEMKDTDFFKSPKFLIIQAIEAFLFADKILTRCLLDHYAQVNPQSISKLKPKDQIFCSVYNRFLSQLIGASSNPELTFRNEHSLFHLGESHCLSYAHKNLKIDGVNYTVLPKITFGGKVFHFSSKNENAYKAITKNNFENIPNGSKVFVSFGEIDCRPNEGFIIAGKKLIKPIDEIMSDSISGYLSWFAKHNARKHCELFFLNVPAPVLKNDIDFQANEEVAKNIVKFNSLISESIKKFKFQLVDVHTFTLGVNGFSNNRYHIDGYHLGPTAIQEIEKQLN